VRHTLLPASGAAAALFLIGAPWWLAALAALAAGAVSTRMARRHKPLGVGEMRALAATLDLLAACLDAGMATTAALSACLDGSAHTDGAHEALAQVSALLLVGGQPGDAWRPAVDMPVLAGLAAAAARSAVGGLTLADAARETAATVRSACRTVVTDRAARAGVAMTAPLAVCFLPAFLCLGLAPTVIGMVTSIHLW
jgi:pilus assembly protein TadC